MQIEKLDDGLKPSTVKEDNCDIKKIIEDNAEKERRQMTYMQKMEEFLKQRETTPDSRSSSEPGTSGCNGTSTTAVVSDDDKLQSDKDISDRSSDEHLTSKVELPNTIV